MSVEELQKECERRAFELIEQGVTINEISMRVIVRQVIKDAMEGKTDEDSLPM